MSSSPGAQLGVFEAGQVYAHHFYHGLGPSAIARIILKPDGKSTYSDTAIANCIAKFNDDATWRGERQPGSGPPRKTSAKLDKQIVNYVKKNRGHERVTVKVLKATFPPLKRLSNTLVEERLHDAELVYLRRRRKTLVEQVYREPRVNFAKWVLQRHDSTLKRWAYSDGTVFYLDRTDAENEHTQRRALGPYVWRMSDGSDALWLDCVGPSSYKKGQGKPLKVWGLLAEGVLHIKILPEGEHMNRWWYAWIVEHHFPNWLGNCDLVVQDYESCLRMDEPLESFRKIGVTLVEGYPKCSQDLNAIENAWKLLKERLFETMPARREGREDFIPRLRAAVDWVNRNKHDALLGYCTNQKKRARDVLSANLPGARTCW